MSKPFVRIPVSDFLALIDRRINPLSVETVPLPEAAGRALAREALALADVPGFDRAAMDGHAVRSADSGPRTVIGDAYPARPFGGTLAPGQAVRTMTGAPLPAGADAVVPFEHGEPQSLPPIAAGKNVGRRGEDVKAGSRLFAAGRVLRPQDLGLLASAGVASVFVHRIPRVSILVTGDELLPAGTTPSGYKIIDSNSVMLTALVRRDGGEPDVAAIVPDRRESIREALLMADGDLVLICGGSSVGLEDHVAAVVAAEGELLAHGVALRPGAPAGFGDLRGRPVFLLPGNPVSCLCGYDLFAGRALRRMVGRGTELPYVAFEVPLAEAVTSAPGRVDYVRVTLEGGRARPLTVRGASVLSTTTTADGFFLLAHDSPALNAGDLVRVHLYDTRR
jgi:molybdopterin molybdotransferase